MKFCTTNKKYQNHGYTKKNPEDLGQHTLISQAGFKVNRIADQLVKFEKKLSVLGRSHSSILNYSRNLAKMALQYDFLPTVLDEDQVTDYIHLLQQEHNTPFDSYFKHVKYVKPERCTSSRCSVQEDYQHVKR